MLFDVGVVSVAFAAFIALLIFVVANKVLALSFEMDVKLEETNIYVYIFYFFLVGRFYFTTDWQL